MGIFDDGMNMLRGHDFGSGTRNEAAGGAADIGSGIAKDGFSSDQTWKGIHDLLHGGAGAIGDQAGNSPVGKVAKAFTFGMDIGDAIAPLIFGDMEQKGSHTEAIPEDGVFKPSTGNKTVDAAVEGIGDAAEFVAGVIPSSLPSLPSLSMPSISLPSLF